MIIIFNIEMDNFHKNKMLRIINHLTTSNHYWSIESDISGVDLFPDMKSVYFFHRYIAWLWSSEWLFSSDVVFWTFLKVQNIEEYYFSSVKLVFPEKHSNFPYFYHVIKSFHHLSTSSFNLILYFISIFFLWNK